MDLNLAQQNAIGPATDETRINVPGRDEESGGCVICGDRSQQTASLHYVRE